MAPCRGRRHTYQVIINGSTSDSWTCCFKFSVSFLEFEWRSLKRFQILKRMCTVKKSAVSDVMLGEWVPETLPSCQTRKKLTAWIQVHLASLCICQVAPSCGSYGCVIMPEGEQLFQPSERTAVYTVCARICVRPRWWVWSMISAASPDCKSCWAVTTPLSQCVSGRGTATAWAKAATATSQGVEGEFHSSDAPGIMMKDTAAAAKGTSAAAMGR